jgi:hypothetical protein
MIMSIEFIGKGQDMIYLIEVGSSELLIIKLLFLTPNS